MGNYFFVIKIFLVSLIFISCKGPMGKTYNPATYEEDIESIRQSNKISEDDIELLTNYMLVSKLAGNDLEGKTYSDILERIKEIRKANGDKNENEKLEQESKRERLSSLLSVKLSEKNFTKVENKDCLVYTVIFQNTSIKNIKIVVGSISINDLLDKEIKKINIMLDENLRGNSTLKKTFIVEYNHSNENDKRIRTIELSNLRVLWNPEKIIFEDGTIAE